MQTTRITNSCFLFHFSMNVLKYPYTWSYNQLDAAEVTDSSYFSSRSWQVRIHNGKKNLRIWELKVHLCCHLLNNLSTPAPSIHVL